MSIVTTERVSEETYRRLALDERNGKLELYQGQLREKPGKSVEHGDIMFHLGLLLQNHLDRGRFRVRTDHARLRRSAAAYYVPDVAVIPAAMERALRERPGSLDAYAEPLPVVVEIWSPSTGDYDIDEKLPGYQQRGDLEIWRVHPYERMITVWRRQPDGTYIESIVRDGALHPVALPGVSIDLDTLFDD